MSPTNPSTTGIPSNPGNKAIITVSPGIHTIRPHPYPTLPPSGGWVLIRATALAINPVDWKARDYEREDMRTDGCNTGFDFAGIVVAVGDGVRKEVKVGERVAGSTNGSNLDRKGDGAFAEYFIAKGDILMRIPDNISDAEAASLGVATLTSTLSLHRYLGFPRLTAPSKPASTIFIYGGTTATALVGIQMAKHSGATVITTSSPSNADYVRSLGADHVLDYRSETLVEDILQAAGGRVQYAWDCHSEAASAAICAAVVQESENAAYEALLLSPLETFSAANPLPRRHTTLGYSVFGVTWSFLGESHEPDMENFELFSETAGVMEGLLAAGKLKTPRVFVNREGSGLEGVVKGVQILKDGGVSAGKLVYTMS